MEIKNLELTNRQSYEVMHHLMDAINSLLDATYFLNPFDDSFYEDGDMTSDSRIFKMKALLKELRNDVTCTFSVVNLNSNKMDEWRYSPMNVLRAYDDIENAIDDVRQLYVDGKLDD